MALATKTRHPTTAHHRKRSGGHHRKQAKHYGKTYWPYLPMLAVAGFGLLLNTVLWQPPRPTQTDGTGSVLAYATNTSTADLLTMTNTQRQTAGEAALATNSQLTSAAQAKANDMATRDYWSHVTPDGRQPWWFVTNAGYQYQSTGENLAYGFDNSQATINGWMNSPGHRANILNVDYQDVGFGIANAEQYQGNGPQTIVVALYGRPAQTTQAAPAKPVTPTVKTSPASAKTVPVPAPVTTVTPATTPTASPAAVLGTEQASRQLAAASVKSRPVSRLQAMRQISPIFMLTIIGLAALAALVFITRHTLYAHRTIVRGEQFMIRHWKFDVAIVSVIVVVLLLTRTAGFIQ